MSKDLSGRDRIGINTLAIWAGQVVVIVTGFVVPRLIDSSLDQDSLGVWDFGWTTVAYFRLLGLGMATGLNRFVALYRAQDNLDDLRRSVSSTSLIQLVVAALTIAVAFGFGEFASRLFSGPNAGLAISAQWLVTLLGLGIAIRMYCWTARGILTGYHMWSHTAAVTACGDIALLILMILNLRSGYGLIGLGICYAGTAVVTESARMYLARRMYGEPFLQWNNVDKRMMLKLVRFGIKTNVVGLPWILVKTVVNIVLASTVGPAALAVYARPLSLARHAQTLVEKFTNILTSTSAGIQGLGEERQLRDFFLGSTKAAFAMTLPLLLVISSYGDIMVRYWMGADYVDPLLAPLICAGLLVTYASSPSIKILVGINKHGRPALQSLAAASVLLAIGVLVGNHVGWSPRVAAIVSGISLSGSAGILMPMTACRVLNVSLAEYLGQIALRPVVLNVPFAASLLVPRLFLPEPSAMLALGILSASGTMLIVLYWQYLMEAEARARLLSSIPILRK